MSTLSEKRLINAGIFGLVGCWLYTFSSFQVYLVFAPAGKILSLFILLSFMIVMICYGVCHAAYFAIASGAHYSARLGSDAESGGKLGNRFFKKLSQITFIPVAVSSILMIYGLFFRHTLYPNWMIIFFPVVIYLMKPLISRLPNVRIKELILDSYDNIPFFLFFLISTIITW